MSLACIISIIVLFYGTIIGFFCGVNGEKGDSAEYTYKLGPIDELSPLFKWSNRFIIPCMLFASPVGFIGIPLLYIVACIFFACFGINIYILNDNTWNIIGPYIVLYLISVLIGSSIGYFVANRVIVNLVKKYNHEE